MSSGSGGAVFKIGIVGPSQVGKTSLITAILEQGRQSLAGTPATLRPRGKTRGAIEQHMEELAGAIQSGEFNPGALGGSSERTIYELELKVNSQSLSLAVLDFPGSWLAESTRPDRAEQDWEECQRFIVESSVLLVPIDASVLMEAGRSVERQAVPRILRTPAVETVAELWAKEREKARHRGEPGLVVFAPLKCESYLADNGGFNNRSEEMLTRVKEVYRTAFEKIQAEAPMVNILYAPVDTYGCVQIKRAEFILNGENAPTFRAHYGFRSPKPVMQPKGADTILGVMCGQIIESAKQHREREASRLKDEAERAQQAATASNFFQAITWFFTREGARREKAAEGIKFKHNQAVRSVEDLSDVVTILSASQPVGRSRWLFRVGTS